VQVALVHQVAADVGADVAFEQHVVGQHHGGTAAGFQAAVDVLQEGELLVAGGVGEVVPAGQAAALLGAEGRVGEDQRGAG
jgi:hypothetical protein